MLNITKKAVHTKVSLQDFKSGRYIADKKYYKRFRTWSLIFLVLLIIILFLPWTQNITGKGKVTTLTPSQRPQTIQSPIPGRIEEWMVQEGDFVKKGDTILKISEIKSEYFDERLLERTSDQIQSKALSIEAYQGKGSAVNSQIAALKNELSYKLAQGRNKIQQAQLKVKSDSVDLVAARTQKNIAETQFQREMTLQQEGLKAMKDVEEKRLKLQSAQAKLISQENKLLESRNDRQNAEIELSSLVASYSDKISKAQGEGFSAKSAEMESRVEVSKLENNYANYQKRNQLLYVTAPQDGYVNKALKAGIGEAFKEGEGLVSIMPAKYQLAVETFVRPIDLPLIHKGEKVRVQFDGWPAIVFSGWEGVSYGTYGARIIAIENFISENGMYRVLLEADPKDQPWPAAVRVGSGAQTIALLNEVPIWYELWRQLNGFPPNYYSPTSNTNEKKK